MRYAAPELTEVADAIRSIEAARFYHAGRRRGGCMAAPVACAAAGDAGDRRLDANLCRFYRKYA
jgi:hypothetical protein